MSKWRFVKDEVEGVLELKMWKRNVLTYVADEDEFDTVAADLKLIRDTLERADGDAYEQRGRVREYPIDEADYDYEYGFSSY